MKHIHMSSDIRLVARENRCGHYLTKDQNRKGHLIPLCQEKGALPNTETLEGIDEIRIGHKQVRQSEKRIVHASKEDRSMACRVLCSTPDIFEHPASACLLLLLALLSRVIDLALPWLPGVPILMLKGTSALPSAAESMLRAINGSEHLTGGKGTYVNRPIRITAIVPLGQTVPSVDVEDYLGGQAQVGYERKERRFWLPLTCRAALISTNLPPAVASKIIESSPLAIPILCTAPKKNLSRPVLCTDGSELFTFNPDMLDQLERWAPLIHAELEQFFCWLIGKKRRLTAWQESAASFYPFVVNGKYVTKVVTEEVGVKVAALSLFKQWLHFASKVMCWLTLEEANKYLLEVWRVMLPESAPTGAGGERTTGKRWDEPNTFWAFITDYLRVNAQHLTKEVPCPTNAVGALHRLPNGDSYFIFPRTYLLTAYAFWLEKNGIAPPQQTGRWETQAQQAILTWGIQLKTEGDDPSWRFRFFMPGQAPNGGKEKLPCLAFPYVQLPESVRTVADSALNHGAGEVNRS